MSDPTPKDEPTDDELQALRLEAETEGEPTDAADPPQWPDDEWQWDRASARENEPDEPEATEATG